MNATQNIYVTKENVRDVAKELGNDALIDLLQHRQGYPRRSRVLEFIARLPEGSYVYEDYWGDKRFLIVPVPAAVSPVERLKYELPEGVEFDPATDLAAWTVDVILPLKNPGGKKRRFIPLSQYHIHVSPAHPNLMHRIVLKPDLVDAIACVIHSIFPDWCPDGIREFLKGIAVE